MDAMLFYFLSLLSNLLQVPNSPIDPTTWFMSLFFVVIVTMVKQGYEDWRRHKSDE